MGASAVEDRLSELVAPVVAETGHDLEQVTVTPAGRRRLVRVIVDSDQGVSSDALAEVSRAVSTLLDDHDVLPGPYTLEVTSPGVSRALTEPRHWRRNRGRLVELVQREGAAVTGRVLDADEGGLTLDVSGEARHFGHDDVLRGRVRVEFRRGTPTDEEATE